MTELHYCVIFLCIVLAICVWRIVDFKLRAKRKPRIFKRVRGGDYKLHPGDTLTVRENGNVIIQVTYDELNLPVEEEE